MSSAEKGTIKDGSMARRDLAEDNQTAQFANHKDSGFTETSRLKNLPHIKKTLRK